MKESELYEPIKNMFSQLDYEVYSEVEGKWYSKRADMVVTQPDKLMVIELKTSLSFQLIDQARFWLNYADYVYVAIPKKKREHSFTAIDCLEQYGIGLIEVDMRRYEMEKNRSKEELLIYSKYAKVVINPKKNEIKPRNSKQFDVLTEEHKTWAEGGSTAKGTKYVTPYALAMNDVYAYLREQLNNPDNDGWVTAKEISEHMEKHSRESVKKHWQGSKIDGINKRAMGISRSLKAHYEADDVRHIKFKNKLHFQIMEESTKYLNT